MFKNKRLIPLMVMALALVALPSAAVELPADLLALLQGQTEPADFTLVEDNFLVYEGYLGPSGDYVAILRNDSPGMAMVSGAELALLDETGNQLHVQTLYAGFPSYVQPGEVTYITPSYLSIPEEALEKISSWQLTFSGIAGEPSEEYLEKPLEAEVVLREYTVEDYFNPGMERLQTDVLVTVTNPTQQPAFDVNTIVLLRDDQGKMVTVKNLSALNVGIPAGGSIILRTNMEPGLLEALAQQKTPITQAEAVALYIQ